jgi:copper transport protein
MNRASTGRRRIGREPEFAHGVVTAPAGAHYAGPVRMGSPRRAGDATPAIRSPRWARTLAAAAVVAAGVLLPASPALAHAVVVGANPPPATGLPQAPGAVVMSFSEPLNLRLSRIRVLARSGHDVGTGPTTAVIGDARAMQRKLGALRPDLYTVAWTTVSRVDGHTLRGSYTFGIGVDPTDEFVTHDNPVASEGWLGLLGRFGALTGLVLWAGAAIAGPVARRSGFSARQFHRLARGAPAATLAGTTASVLSAAVVSSGSMGRAGDVLFGSPSGHWRFVVLIAAAAGVLLPSRWHGPWRLLAVVAVGAEAASGHAAGASVPALAVATLVLHLCAVGIWIFAMVTAVVVGTVRGRQGLVDALAGLSRWAVAAAGIVALTGIANAAIELNGPGELASSGYGQAVGAKAGAFLGMIVAGMVHYRRRHRPGKSSLAVPLRVEAVGAALALAVATALVGFPNPPRQAEASERTTGGDPVLSHLAGTDALSVADASGPFVIGLTVLPPRPGPVELRVQVLGIDPGDGLRQAHVRGSGPDGDVLDVDLVSCGLGCFAGRGEIGAVGDWRLEASVVSNRGPAAMGVTVPLPTQDGSAQLQRALAAVAQLGSARMHEALRGSTDGPLLSSDYAFQAPDGFEFQINGTDEIVLGGVTFRREAPGLPWKAKPSGYAFDWPGSYFSSFWGPGVAARVVGHQDVDGVASTIVAFVRPNLPAWFRIWIGDGDGLVRREEMRTQGHLMDHTWTALDQPVDLRPPL